jgi:hypothetical protein
MTLGILRACYVSWLLPGLEWNSVPLQSWEQRPFSTNTAVRA